MQLLVRRFCWFRTLADLPFSINHTKTMTPTPPSETSSLLYESVQGSHHRSPYPAPPNARNCEVSQNRNDEQAGVHSTTSRAAPAIHDILEPKSPSTQPPPALRYNEALITSVRDKFADSHLASRIVCLLVHGSALHHSLENNPQSDIDLELVLSESCEGDALFIRGVVSSCPVKIECQYRYLSEVCSQDGLVRRSKYNLFGFFAYNNSVCLLGTNIYTSLVSELPRDEVEHSLVIGTQLAFKNVRKFYLAGAPAHEVNKMVVRFLHFLGMAASFIDVTEIGTKAHGSTEIIIGAVATAYRDRLTSDDLAHLMIFAARYRGSEFYTPIVEVCSRIRTIFEIQMFSHK